MKSSKGSFKGDSSLNKFVFSSLLFLACLSVISYATGADLSCSITDTGSCSDTIVLYIENSTGGYIDSHAQNVSVGTYNYAVCCNADVVGRTVGIGCGDTVFLKLSDTDNAHVEQPSVGTYSVDACISLDMGSIGAVPRAGDCSGAPARAE